MERTRTLLESWCSSHGKAHRRRTARDTRIANSESVMKVNFVIFYQGIVKSSKFTHAACDQTLRPNASKLDTNSITLCFSVFLEPGFYAETSEGFAKVKRGLLPFTSWIDITLVIT
jgi:hypothetical protein